MFESRLAGLMSVVVLLGPGALPARAQEAVHSFDQLRVRVAPGESVILTDVRGEDVQGTVRTLSSSAITLDVDGARHEYLETEVRRISRRDSRWNGTLWGLAAGGLLGAWADRALVNEYGRDDIGAGDSAAFVAGAAGAGAAIGFGVDALVRGRRVLYTNAATTTRRRTTVVPLWTVRSRGVLVQLRFR